MVLLVAFLLVPVVEIYVIIQVGQVIGALPTVALLVFEGLLGSWLVRREGRVAWNALRASAGSGRLPTKELTDAGLILVVGTLLLTPGFVTDVFGFFFVLPPTRPLARRLLRWFIARRATRVVVARVPWAAPPRDGGPHGSRPAGGSSGSRVVTGETLPDGPTPPDDKGPGRATGG
jgi:UPF0716 protein FxsA